MNILFGILSGYFCLYLVIWLHEVGHAIFLTGFGCKNNPFHVSVHPYLYGSTPGETNYEKLGKIASWKVAVMSYAGIGVNILFGTFLLMLIHFLQPVNFYVALLMYQFMTLHYAEAITYLFFSNIVLSSDMLQIALINPKPVLHHQAPYTAGILQIHFPIADMGRNP